MHVSGSQKQYVRNLLKQGNKIEAIKYLKENFQLGLKEAKKMAELIETDIEEDEIEPTLKNTDATNLTEGMEKIFGIDLKVEEKRQIHYLMMQGKKKEAIIFLTDLLRTKGTLSRTIAFFLESSLPKSERNYSGSKPFSAARKPGKIIGFVFASIGALMLVGTIWIFIHDMRIISHSQLITGKVISNPSSPLIEYEFDGEKFQYQSAVSSSPPSYSLGEEVEVYVDLDNPHQIIINTFTDRWLLIIILCVMGGIFFIIGSIVFLVFRKS